MGICLDTDKIPDDKNFDNDSKDRQIWDADDTGETFRNDTDMFSHSNGHVKFDTPKVPVIFVLGGPGSGKVTHCDNLMIEKRGIVHINMTDLLQQYTVGNDMEDFSKLSSKTVTEVLMLELKMSPAAKTFLISGFPRNMRDVVEYSNKIKVVNGVILISWNQSVLERQIDYGAKLGHVVLSLARMELNNFYKNVQPVSDFYDQRGMLISVNGERSPTEVYNDFRSSVLQILSAHNGPPAPAVVVVVPNGDVRPPDDDRAARQRPTDPAGLPTLAAADRQHHQHAVPPVPPESADDRRRHRSQPAAAFPRVICVVGGPGSNKSSLCQKVLRANSGWGHVSIGPYLRSLASSQERLQDTISSGQIVEDVMIEVGGERRAFRRFTVLGDVNSASRLFFDIYYYAQQQNREWKIRETEIAKKLIEVYITKFETVIVHNVLDKELLKYKNAEGIVIDGYPRNIGQLNYFEKKYAQQPKLILLDCSKLQLGRGRLDDSVSAFRRRLESFREQTLPMLKALDRDHRLAVVDGNTDDKRVQENFIGMLVETMKGDNFPVFQDADEDFDATADAAAAAASSDDPEKRHAAVAGPAAPHQNGNIPNQLRHDDGADHDDRQDRRLRHDVRNMYAQIGSYPKDPVL